MVKIYERNYVVILESDEFDLKVDNNRIVYYRKKGDSSFKSSGHELSSELNIEDRKKYLYELYLGVVKYQQDVQKNTEESNQ